MRNIFISVSLLLAAATASVVLAGDAALALRPAVEVDGTGVMLDQLIASDRPLPSLRLTNSPAVGQTLVLNRSQILAAARGHVPDLPTNGWSGPELTRVARRSRPLEESELLGLLTAQLQRQFTDGRGELELHLARPWTVVNVPDETVSLRVTEFPPNGLSPAMILRFELKGAHEVLGSWQAVIQCRLWREVWVARSPLSRGQSLRDADLARERRDMLSLHQALANVAAEDGSVEIAENVPPGSPLYARSVRLRPVVHPGKRADALVQDGGMVISVKVEVLEEGVPGQMVRVRNIKSQREFKGKVQDEQTVIVTI
jgi:flagellar basal body P-ring formation protein FlgA